MGKKNGINVFKKIKQMEKLQRFKLNEKLIQVEDLYFSMEDNTGSRIAEITGLKIHVTQKYIDKAIKNRLQLKSISVNNPAFL
jgi:hypothetical protein